MGLDTLYALPGVRHDSRCGRRPPQGAGASCGALLRAEKPAVGNVRHIQEEQFGNCLIASDLANPDFVRFAESLGTPPSASAAAVHLLAGILPLGAGQAA